MHSHYNSSHVLFTDKKNSQYKNDSNKHEKYRVVYQNIHKFIKDKFHIELPN
jgi:hypothetical protein